MAELARSGLRCGGCGTEIAPALLACPACRQLVHAGELKRLAAEALASEERSDAAGALAAWRGALALLPPGTRQHETVAASVARWTAAAPAAPDARSTPAWVRRLGPIAVVAFGAWKLVGIAKLAPLLSVLASFGVYWQLWGWRFAAGFVAAIYVHELGHVVALRRAGIPASAPMFIPGIGAFVRMHSAPSDPRTDARVGLAGPVAGLAATLVLFGIATSTGAPLARALAHASAVVNLFNLVPIWSLDGSRGFAALVGWQRVGIALVTAGALATTNEGILWLVLIVAALRAFSPRVPEEPDHAAFGVFAGLVAGLTWVAFAAR